MTQVTSPPPAPEARPGGPAAIAAHGLGHRFGDHTALEDGLELVVPAGGGVVGLLGPNGSGKSTLMRLLLGLVPRQQGEIVIDGMLLTGDGVAVRRRATYAPGELHLHGEFTGARELAFLLRGRGRAALRRAKGIAEELGLPLKARVRGYSHGMKRQLLFAAALAPDVRVRILDEISEGLDPAKRSEILDRIEADAARGTSILLSSHHLGEVDRVCDRLVFMAKGRCIADETAEDVRRRAQRMVAVEYKAPDAARAAAALADDASLEIVSARLDASGTRVHFETGAGDTRPLLAALATRPGLEAPRAIEYGQVSLRELYRSLYGVEGT